MCALNGPVLLIANIAGNPFATGREIILLTVFRKQRRRERAEIDRAIRVMETCIAEGHIAEDEDE